MQKFVFFGLGAAGSVMACALEELCRRRGERSRFLFVVRDRQRAARNLHRAPRVLAKAEFLVVKDLDRVSRRSSPVQVALRGATVVVNAATPRFNDRILDLAVAAGSHYCDLASEMYDSRTRRTLQFSQERFHDALLTQRRFALINAGISPGVTNFMVGERLRSLGEARPVRAIDLYLLEHIESRRVLFSWSPSVALDELEQKPRYVEGGRMRTVAPFGEARSYAFPHHPGAVMTYPVYQEEILSLRRSYPAVGSIRMFAGGSEVDLVRALFQLNLLSKRDVTCVKKGLSVEEIVRRVIPEVPAPQEVEKLLEEGVIRDAQFAAMAEVTLAAETTGRGAAAWTRETTGVSFHRYRELLGTPYAGATYVAYVTGVGAAVLLFYAVEAWRERPEALCGVRRAEELPAILGASGTDDVKRELCTYRLDCLSHTHSFQGP